jgi:hypothetical protein
VFTWALTQPERQVRRGVVGADQSEFDGEDASDDGVGQRLTGGGPGGGHTEQYGPEEGHGAEVAGH